MKTKLCAAFCGVGKSYLCDNFPNDYMEIECWEYRSGDFPKNYVNDIIESIGKTKYIFVSSDPVVLKELNRRGIQINLYYPENKLKYEYLERFIARESSFDFIGVIMVNWDNWINQLKEQDYCNSTILHGGQYLSDVL